MTCWRQSLRIDISALDVNMYDDVQLLGPVFIYGTGTCKVNSELQHV